MTWLVCGEILYSVVRANSMVSTSQTNPPPVVIALLFGSLLEDREIGILACVPVDGSRRATPTNEPPGTVPVLVAYAPAVAAGRGVECRFATRMAAITTAATMTAAPASIIIGRRSRRRASDGPSGSASRSAAARPPALRYRSSGRLAMPFATTPSTAGGRWGRDALGPGGASWWCPYMTAAS